MLCAACCNVRVRMCSARVPCVCTERFVRGWRVGSRIVGCLLALLALFKGKWIEPKQHRFNVNSKLVCIIFQYCFVSIYFPLSSTSKTNIQPTILLPTHQPLTQCAAHAHCTHTLQQGAHNMTPRSTEHYTKECVILHQSERNNTICFPKFPCSYRASFFT